MSNEYHNIRFYGEIRKNINTFELKIVPKLYRAMQCLPVTHLGFSSLKWVKE